MYSGVLSLAVLIISIIAVTMGTAVPVSHPTSGSSNQQDTVGVRGTGGMNSGQMHQTSRSKQASATASNQQNGYGGDIENEDFDVEEFGTRPGFDHQIYQGSHPIPQMMMMTAEGTPSPYIPAAIEEQEAAAISMAAAAAAAAAAAEIRGLTFKKSHGMATPAYGNYGGYASYGSTLGYRYPSPAPMYYPRMAPAPAYIPSASMMYRQPVYYPQSYRCSSCY